MSEYQSLTAEIQVPKEWPVERLRNVILELVKMAIRVHQSDEKVSITIRSTSAMVTKTKTGYVLRKVKEIRDLEVFKITLFTPMKVLLLNFKPGGPKFIEEESLKSLPMDLRSNHTLSKMFMKKLNFDKVVIATPNLKGILKLKGIKGSEMYPYMLQSTYKFKGIDWIEDVLSDKELSQSTMPDTIIFLEEGPDDLLDIVCYERLPLPT